MEISTTKEVSRTDLKKENVPLRGSGNHRTLFNDNKNDMLNYILQKNGYHGFENMEPSLKESMVQDIINEYKSNLEMEPKMQDKITSFIKHPATITTCFIGLLGATVGLTYYLSKSDPNNQLNLILDYLKSQAQLGEQRCATIKHVYDLIVDNIPNNITESGKDFIIYMCNNTLEFANTVCANFDK
ncbi:MAG: hypothetical protein ACK5Z5_07945 [Neisseriaceae bacterium]